MVVRIPRSYCAASLAPFLYPSFPPRSLLLFRFASRRLNSTNSPDSTTSSVDAETTATPENTTPETEPSTEPSTESSTEDEPIPTTTWTPPRPRNTLNTSDPGPLPSTADPSHPHHDHVAAPFSDLRQISLAAGAGGHGCVSFVREKFVAHGPPNGGDGGAGGSIYIQAVYGETSLHKLGRQGAIRAGQGQNGKGSALNGRRGDDIVIHVPVGTVVTELSRWDPTEAENDDGSHADASKWTHYPNALQENLADEKFTATPYPSVHHKSASHLLRHTHPTRVHLDLATPTASPILLLPGSPGGLGNPHFCTPANRRPKFATKGNKGARMTLQLELKVLADVGLVGLPNAGKSSFLRAVSGRRARVGEWAFTTLTPNIGTIVLDHAAAADPARERFTIADIPGLIADAHLDKGLGLGFLRHIERARVLAFVLDLSRPDPVADLQSLWAEVRAYEAGLMGDGAAGGMMDEMLGSGIGSEMAVFSPVVPGSNRPPKVRKVTSMGDKPWFVVANKADVEGTEERYALLRAYLGEVGRKRGKEVGVVPISALRAEGVERAVEWMRGMLDM
ncbi:P-loop containing nucleoside triphosphate hydrolase protein [Geopyxis carbonaria]|nr:P-loop containing nucleoside triphosphate hydrolase protein [Geopyxis carbonaria]